MESKFLYITLTLSTIAMVSGDSGFTQTCTPGEARLIHGTTSMEGVLEICNNNFDWGTVCSRVFYCEEATVSCRQVGYDFAYSWYTNYTGLNGRPEYGIYSCSGLESSLLDCPHNWYYYYQRRDLDNDYYCGQTRVAGVRCVELPEPNCDIENDVRLVGGPKESEGQLQMCIDEHWRDVCSSSTSYYKNLGIIACRQLGYTSRWISALGNRHYYNSSVQPQLFTQLRCYNNYYNNLSYCNSHENCVNCNGNEMAIKCEFETTDCVNNSLRLIGGPSIVEGWLEICIDGIWGRIVNNIEGKTKDFACAKLGFSETGGTVIRHYDASRYYGTTNSPAMVKYINCCGHDETFGDCDFEYIATDEYVSDNYLALRCIDGCTHGDMRLTGARRDHEGIVEVCISGTWRHIGLNGWDDIDANVVCQNLYPGKTYESASATNSSDYEQSHRQVYYDYVSCDSYDTSLIYGCGYGYASSTYTGPVAAVYCYPRCSCEKSGKRSVESEIGNFIQQK